MQVGQRSRSLQRQAGVVANITPTHRQRNHSGLGEVAICKQERGDAFSGVLSEISARPTFGVVEQLLVRPEWRIAQPVTDWD